ncbi:lysozyme [Sphingomonas sp. AR_OL41]|uniref:lysozyme n=1 Tax=Sphingomonas sp. AR_OL41 TaxID=3042729 RepID=UPI00248126C8|nr:lysozyme [Sphingomonas sp. AR_OL41]MDH7971059.1 lysozyme [Sphingomonas sp. AR_OL41]
MTPSSNCISLIKQFEGCRLKAYPDPGTGGAPWTIGYGSPSGIKPGMVWTQAMADAALAKDVGIKATGVMALLGNHQTTQGQFDALVSFAFNCGLANLKASTLIKKHLAGDYKGAALEFAKWNKAAGKVMAGLTKRRAAEAVLYAR